MCGVVGFWSKDSGLMSQSIFDVFIDTLSHRGPDGRGSYHLTDENIWLGHRRLNIFDLSTKAKQPFSYLNERYWITYNGEVYNFLELRSELIAQGYSFDTDSDTEVILACYDLYRENCLYKFNGMWAFAIYDTLQKSFFISRDRFGVKPLYYFYDSNTLAFASELKAFLALPFYEFDFDTEKVTRFLPFIDHKITDRHQTFLKGIKELPAGHYAILSQSKEFKIERWWDTKEHIPQIPSSPKQMIANFKELFLDACKLRLRGDVNIGFTLSGGLDSSSVLSASAYLAKMNQLPERCASNWLNAFVATYPNTVQDESHFAKQVIDHTKANGHYVEIDPAEISHEYLEHIAFSYESFEDIALGPWFLYQSFRKQNIFISLDGHGGDELLGGYHHQIQQFLNVYKFPHLIKKWDIHRIYNNLYKNSHLTPPKNPKQKKRTLKNEFFDDAINNQLYYDFHFESLPPILRNFDIVSMAHGIEIRAPLMDYRVVSYAFAMPGSWKAGHGYTKRALREITKDFLVESIRTRKSKIGFVNPTLQWIEKSFYKIFLERARNFSFLNSSIFDGNKISFEINQAYSQKDFKLMFNYWPYIVADMVIESFKCHRKKYLAQIKDCQSSLSGLLPN